MILVVCLNPALQRTLWFDGFDTNRVNRAVRRTLSAGGKGVNVARVIAQLKETVTLLTLLGGETGTAIQRHLDLDGIPHHAVRIQNDTRTCLTLLDTVRQTQTEIVEEGRWVSKSEIDETKASFLRLVPDARMVIFSGTAAPGFPKTIYLELIRLYRGKSVTVVADGSLSYLQPVLKANPVIVKPNWSELEDWCGRRLINENEARAAMEMLYCKGAQSVLITKGEPWALFLWEDVFYRVISPRLKVVNSIGSGDATAAGIGVGLSRGWSMLESVRYGMACGSANVLTDLAGHVRIKDVDRILSKVKIEKI